MAKITWQQMVGIDNYSIGTRLVVVDTEHGKGLRLAEDTCKIAGCDGLLADYDNQLCDGHADEYEEHDKEICGWCPTTSTP